MPRIDIYGNPNQLTHIDHLRRFFGALIHAGARRICVEPVYLEFLRAVLPEYQSSLSPILTGDSDRAALALSIGGDGTFLTTANTVGGSGIPVMGINAGHLGYLSATDIGQADEVADKIVAGHYITESRTLLKVDSTSHSLPAKPFALNEAAFLKQDTASIITVDVHVNGNYLASYSGDGLIVSTPTGSTGYNLSAGGPILSPRSTDWIITPIAPHSLSMRPLVVPDSAVIKVSCRSRSRSMLLAIDGRSVALPIDSRFTLTKAPFCIEVAHLPGHTFAETLRRKLHWGTDRT